jgi:hypothetical protein
MVDELTKVNQKEHREDPRVGNSIKPFVLGLGNAAVWCQWKRGDCVAWRRLQQDVSISKWTGKESQQRFSLLCARYEASAGAKEETVFCVSSDGFLEVFH